MDLHTPNTIRITCAPGLGPYLEQELAGLGYAVESTHETAVEIAGTKKRGHY